jgi:hypothetical protein
MRHRTPARLAALLVSLATSFAAAAEPLRPAWIPAEATWIVHIDIQAGTASTIGGYLLAHRDHFQARGMEQFRQQLGIDPARDLKGITIYGESCEPEDAVALISATAATDSFLDRLRAQDSSYQQVKGERYTLDRWTEHGTPRFGYVRKSGEDERLILVSQDMAKLEQAIARTDPAAAAQPASALLAEAPAEGSIVFAVATDLSSAAGRAKGMAVQKLRDLRLDMGETPAGAIYAEGLITTASPGDAQNLKQMLEGAMAMGRMAVHRRPELAELAELSHSVAFTTSDSAVKLAFRHDSQKALDMLKAVHEARTGTPAPPAPDASEPAPPSPGNGDDRKP